MNTDEHTVLLINKIEELSPYIQKSKIIMKSKLQLPVNYHLPLEMNSYITVISAIFTFVIYALCTLPIQAHTNCLCHQFNFCVIKQVTSKS